METKVVNIIGAIIQRDGECMVGEVADGLRTYIVNNGRELGWLKWITVEGIQSSMEGKACWVMWLMAMVMGLVGH